MIPKRLSILSALPLALSAMFLAATVPVSLADGEKLFNGKDLAGWDGDPRLWSVKDGVLVGETNDKEKKVGQNSFLIWKGGELEDFELTLKARVTGNNNSGIQYRSKVLDAKKWSVGGYQADMHAKQEYLGMMYEERGRGIMAQRGESVIFTPEGKKEVVKTHDISQDKVTLSDWNEYKVIARGIRLEHYVNGKLTISILDRDKAKRSMKGVLALQVHAGGPMKLEAKDIVLKKLAPEEGEGAEAPRKAVTKEPQSPPPAPVAPVQPAAPIKSPVIPPKYIWSSKEAKESEVAYFRLVWSNDVRAKSARLLMTCDNQFTVWCNGRLMGGGDKWNETYEIDLTKPIRAGRNVIAVKAVNTGGAAALIGRLELTMPNGFVSKLVTDRYWKVSNVEGKNWNQSSFRTTKDWKRAEILGNDGMEPWGNALKKEPVAALPANIKSGTVKPVQKQAASRLPGGDKLGVAEGFKVEKMYDVPKNTQGSWVAMTVDPKGRLIVSDQYGALHRVTLPGLGAKGDEVEVETLKIPLTGAHGLLYAFDSLYVCKNEGPGGGLYRVTDGNGDGELDQVTKLRDISGGGEHGPHAIVLSHDGKSLFVLGGNHTKLPNPEASRVPKGWQEDQLLYRFPDGRGHARGVMAPGGWICKTDPDGKSWELVSTGYRNQYDAAINEDGELFTYDSDMEWDIGTPWYRPTRVNHATSGSEFGWRNGAGKLPAYYPDTLPSTIDIGPGCPTGVIMGTGAKFPAKYQKALFILDWTYGTMYAIHHTPKASSYVGEKEEFVTGVPLNLTDIVIHPTDGAMYFTVGGRRSDSALYKVTYTGSESTARVDGRNKEGAEDRALRRSLEAFHTGPNPKAVDAAWPHLGHSDRYIRFAARLALEHQPVDQWKERALKEPEAEAALSALLALARQGDKSLLPQVTESLAKLSVGSLEPRLQLDWLRTAGLAFIRMGTPSPAHAKALIEKLDPLYPNANDNVNRELCRMLVYLKAPTVVPKTVSLMSQDSTAKQVNIDANLLERSKGYGSAFKQTMDSGPQQQQIHYSLMLCLATEGWTPDLRKQYFAWFPKARAFKGGNSFVPFIENFRKRALDNAPESERAALDAISKAPVQELSAEWKDARKIELGMIAGMKFAKESLTVKAGEKVSILINNNDPTQLMHNFVLVQPGTLDHVVEAATALGADGLAVNFLPESEHIIAASPIVLPGKVFVLNMKAPEKPGKYPYVCTYPGHAILMRGVLTVE